MNHSDGSAARRSIPEPGMTETWLPGIGRKFDVRTKSGDRMVVVAYHDGRRGLFHMAAEDGEPPISDITLDDDEARAVAAIVAGMSYKPKSIEVQEAVLDDDLIIDWLRLDTSGEWVGRTIGELAIRERTGATVIAVIEQGRRTVLNPGVEYVFGAGSTVVVVGDRGQFQLVKQLMAARNIS